MLLAGGMGTRLGCKGPKGVFDIGVTHELYIFEQLFRNAMDSAKAAGKEFPFFIMTSDKNHEETVSFLKEHDFFMIYEFYCSLIRDKTGTPPDKHTRKLLEMYCQASIYMTVQWLMKGMKESEEELADLMIDAMPVSLSEQFLRINIL